MLLLKDSLALFSRAWTLVRKNFGLIVTVYLLVVTISYVVIDAIRFISPQSSKIEANITIFISTVFVELIFVSASALLTAIFTRHVEGTKPTLRNAMTLVWGQAGGLLGFVLLSAIVLGFNRFFMVVFGQVFIEIGWRYLMVLMIPIMIMERKGLFAALDRILYLMGNVWREMFVCGVLIYAFIFQAFFVFASSLFLMGLDFSVPNPLLDVTSVVFALVSLIAMTFGVVMMIGVAFAGYRLAIERTQVYTLEQ